MTSSVLRNAIVRVEVVEFDNSLPLNSFAAVFTDDDLYNVNALADDLDALNDDEDDDLGDKTALAAGITIVVDDSNNETTVENVGFHTRWVTIVLARLT